MRLVQAIGEEGERWSAGTWTSGAIERQLLGAIAVAVQRGNALAMLTGYTRATRATAEKFGDRLRWRESEWCEGSGGGDGLVARLR